MNNFLNLKDIPSSQLRKILSDARIRKKKRKNLNALDKDKDKPLRGKFLIQMFEKSSLRTRISFYLAIKQLGGSSLTLRPDELHLSKGGESLSDTAKILSTYGNIFMLRTDNDKKIEDFKKFLKIPLINALSPSGHPLQILCDIFTIEEIKKTKISNLKICWIGDTNNVLNSLIEGSVKFSFKLNIACPKKYQPKYSILNWAKRKKGKIKVFQDIKEAARNADVVFTDKVISMNDKVNKLKKLNTFKDFKVTRKVMSYASKKAIFLHCLPRGTEVTDEVFLSKQSKVWQQALNRIYVQKSILLYCLDKLR